MVVMIPRGIQEFWIMLFGVGSGIAVDSMV